jgi:hypothetical protein
MSGSAEDKIEALQLAVERLTQGLTLMAETQEIHTAMLVQLLQAAAAPMPEASPVADALSKLAATISTQTLLLHEMSRGLDRLPEEVGREVAGGLRTALGDVT